MSSASAVRLQVESALAERIPSALTPAPKVLHPVASTGIEALDDVLCGGLPVGAITELMGPECSGRTAVALSFVARLTQASKVCAWIDVTDNFDPVSAAATGLHLQRLLWVRCGVPNVPVSRTSTKPALLPAHSTPSPVMKESHGGGWGSHPRGEVKGISEAISGFLRSGPSSPQSTRSQLHPLPNLNTSGQQNVAVPMTLPPRVAPKPWARIEQALRTADLLLQAGGFTAIVLDMASLSPNVVSRVPLATWHRYRLASQRTQSSILLLTQHSCAKSSAELLLRLRPAEIISDENTVFTGFKPQVEVARQRFTQTTGRVIPLRKPPQNANTASWPCRTAWAGER